MRETCCKRRNGDLFRRGGCCSERYCNITLIIRLLRKKKEQNKCDVNLIMRLFAFLPAALAAYQSICESPAFLLPAIRVSRNISRPRDRMRRSIVVHGKLTALFPVAFFFFFIFIFPH